MTTSPPSPVPTVGAFGTYFSRRNDTTPLPPAGLDVDYCFIDELHRFVSAPAPFLTLPFAR